MKEISGTYSGVGVICLTNYKTNVTEKVTTDFEITVSEIHPNNYTVKAFINKNLTLDSFDSNAFYKKSDTSLMFCVRTRTEITDGESTLEVRQDGVGSIDFSKYENCGYVTFGLSTEGRYSLNEADNVTYGVSTSTKLKRKKVY
jgi:hypothetical protein